MIAQKLYRLILRRPFFRGQDRIFNYLFTRNRLGKKPQIVSPITGNFKVKCNPLTWIGAKIIYTGEYESELKKIFKSIINKGDYVLNVGANVGFHTLYFAELTGKNGKVSAFEPVPHNFEALNFNVNLNDFDNILTKQVALGNKNEELNISVDVNHTNPGSYNLFDQQGDTLINCVIGDEMIGEDKVDFIKIDVEGYESFVIDGLLQTIKKNRPKIIFEYDKYYHHKTGLPENHILLLLNSLNYHFFHINQKGAKVLDNFQNIKSGNILAIPNE